MHESNLRLAISGNAGVCNHSLKKLLLPRYTSEPVPNPRLGIRDASHHHGVACVLMQSRHLTLAERAEASLLHHALPVLPPLLWVMLHPGVRHPDTPVPLRHGVVDGHQHCDVVIRPSMDLDGYRPSMDILTAACHSPPPKAPRLRSTAAAAPAARTWQA